MVKRLADRLADEPDDVEGWTRLERAYTVLGEAEKAANARQMIEKYSN
jgi:cytochrome c-type biogenesis protein CcmH